PSHMRHITSRDTGTPHVQRRSSVRSLILAAMAVLIPSVALAADAPAAGGSMVGPYAVLAAGFGMALAAGLCGLGQGRAVASAVEAIGRQPGAAARIHTAMIIGLAPIESLATHVLCVCQTFLV